MKRLYAPEPFRGRFFAFFLVLATPIVRLLLRSHYEPWRPEVAAILGLIALPCLLLAWISRRIWVFFGLLLGLITVFSASSVQIDLLPGVRWRYVALLLAVALGAAIAVFRRRFQLLLIVWIGGMILVDVAKWAVKGAEGRAATQAAVTSSPPPRHVVYLIFDEQIGLAGFPTDIPECREAKHAFEEVLARHNFRVYPGAFSNYRRSWNSIPSILNDRLARENLEQMRPAGPKQTLVENALFESHAKAGYDLAIYYSDYLKFSSPRYRYRIDESYDSNDLSALLVAPCDWRIRMRQILWRHIQSDWLIGSLIEDALSLQAGDGMWSVGPLAVRRVWPARILEDIRRAPRPTMFFAHLLHPHHPYVYDRTGVVQPPATWMRIAVLDPKPRETYIRQCRAYAEQSMFLAHQLDWFLSAMRDAGVLDSATVIIHGDHGSRLRLLTTAGSSGSRAVAGGMNPGDGPAEAELRDLLSRYSTLLAIKPAGASRPETNGTKGSVLYHLRRFRRPGAAEEPGVNSVFLFDENGSKHEIPILKYWK